MLWWNRLLPPPRLPREPPLPRWTPSGYAVAAYKRFTLTPSSPRELLSEVGAGERGAGAKGGGGSRRAAVFSLIGSLGGTLLGAAVGLPIPIVGSALGVVLGGALGALAGAVFAEYTLGEKMQQSFRVGRAAFWGRLLGTGVKTFIATLLVVILLGALLQ